MIRREQLDLDALLRLFSNHFFTKDDAMQFINREEIIKLLQDLTEEELAKMGIGYEYIIDIINKNIDIQIIDNAEDLLDYLEKLLEDPNLTEEEREELQNIIDELRDLLENVDLDNMTEEELDEFREKLKELLIEIVEITNDEKILEIIKIIDDLFDNRVEVSGDLQEIMDKLTFTGTEIMINHNLNDYPVVRVLSYMYGAGIIVDGPAGGTNVTVIDADVQFNNPYEVTITLPKYFENHKISHMVSNLAKTRYVIFFEDIVDEETGENSVALDNIIIEILKNPCTDEGGVI